MLLPLDGLWKLAGFDPGGGLVAGAHGAEFADSAWIDAQVPGDVHSALLAAGRIEDPYLDQNIEKCAWVEGREWWYRTAFEAPTLAPGDRADLVFEGLDTFATVYVNGQAIGSTANMLVPHRLDATGCLRPGTNVIAIRFDPTVATVETRDCSPFWAAFYTPRVWVRKAAMNFGWDWGPRLVTCGVWRSARLEVHRRARIESHYVRTHAITPEHAVLHIGAEVELLPDAPDRLVLRATLEHAGHSITGVALFSATSGHMRLLVPDPELWWPSGHGDQPLHRLTIEVLTMEGQVLDTRTDQIGIRTLAVLQEPDADGLGKSFNFVVNGRRVFCKGADWIPADNLIGSIPAERYRDLVSLGADGNMNMYRVWGGGIYEDDAFYRACDELGVMVWQDFMFSCAAYPDFDPDFMANVRYEAEQAVKRLRNHPCIALWCGNNENDWLDDMQNRGDPPRPFYGRRIYHDLLPGVCARLDPTRQYWPSSPYGGSDDNSEWEGDRHNWQVWGGQVYPHRFGEPYRGDPSPANVSFRQYAKDMCRFCSEYGLHASPPLRTLLDRTGPLEYDSEEMLYRIKDPDKARKQRQMDVHSGQPKNLEQYEIFSMLVQAEGLRFAIEHYRRRMFDCGGSLFWQLNDCWPCISWAVVDYDLNPKAGWYYARRAYAPIALSLKVEADMAGLYVVSDRRDDVPVSAVLITVDTVSRAAEERSVAGIARANASTLLSEFTLADLGIADPSRQGILLREARGLAPEHMVFLPELKDVELPPVVMDLQVEASGGKATIGVSADGVAHFVAIDVGVRGAILTDNYFSLLPGQQRTVTARAKEPIRPEAVSVRCLNNVRS